MKYRSLTNSFAVNFIRTVLNLLFPIASFAYASRILGAEGVGIVSYTDSIIKYLVLIGGGGILFYGIRETAKVRENREELEKTVGELFVVNLLLTGVACLLLLFLLTGTVGKQYSLLFLIQGSVVLFNGIGMEWLYQAKEEFVYITIRTAALQLLAFIALFLFVRKKEDYIAYTVITVFAVAGTQVLNFIRAGKYLRVLKSRKRLELRKHFRLMKYIFGANLAISLYLHIDKTMLGIMASTNAVGLYTGANNITRSAAGLLTCITNVSLPRISYYLENNKKEEAFRLIEDSGNIILMFAVPAAIGLACISKTVIVLVCGTEFEGAYSALMILAVDIIFSVYNNYWVWQIFLPLNKEKLVFTGTVCSALINLCLNFIWIPRYGILGAAGATLMAEIILTGLCIHWGKIVLGEKGISPKMWHYPAGGLGVLIVCLAVEVFMGNTVTAMIIKIAASIGSYILVLCLLKNEYLKRILIALLRLTVRRKQY